MTDNLDLFINKVPFALDFVIWFDILIRKWHYATQGAMLIDRYPILISNASQTWNLQIIQKVQYTCTFFLKIVHREKVWVLKEKAKQAPWYFLMEVFDRVLWEIKFVGYIGDEIQACSEEDYTSSWVQCKETLSPSSWSSYGWACETADCTSCYKLFTSLMGYFKSLFRISMKNILKSVQTCPCLEIVLEKSHSIIK